MKKIGLFQCIAWGTMWGFIFLFIYAVGTLKKPSIGVVENILMIFTIGVIAALSFYLGSEAQKEIGKKEDEITSKESVM